MARNEAECRSAFVALRRGDRVLTVASRDGVGVQPVSTTLPGGVAEPREYWMQTLARLFGRALQARLPYKRYSYVGWGLPGHHLRVYVARVTEAEARRIEIEAGAFMQWVWVDVAELARRRLPPHIATALALLDTLASTGCGDSEWIPVSAKLAVTGPRVAPAAAIMYSSRAPSLPSDSLSWMATPAASEDAASATAPSVDAPEAGASAEDPATVAGMCVCGNDTERSQPVGLPSGEVVLIHPGVTRTISPDGNRYVLCSRCLCALRMVVGDE